MNAGNIRSSLISENIGGAIDWSICRDRHVLVVHLGGTMDTLETEMDGAIASIGPALAGECWLIPAGCRYASAANGGLIYYAELEMAPDALRYVRPSSKLAAWADPYLAKLSIAAAQGDSDASSLVTERLDEILKHREIPTVQPLSRPALSSTLRFIDNGLDEDINLKAMAAHAGRSVNAFIKAFTASLGETPTQYVIRQRLRRAQWYLLNSQYDITTIALKTGFSSHAHLTSTFSQRTGRSPSRWRQIEQRGRGIGT